MVNMPKGVYAELSSKEDRREATPKAKSKRTVKKKDNTDLNSLFKRDKYGRIVRKTKADFILGNSGDRPTSLHPRRD